jgi:hypothetical protein
MRSIAKILLCCNRVHFFDGKVIPALNVRSRDQIKHFLCTHKGNSMRRSKARDASDNSCSHGPYPAALTSRLLSR